MRYDKTVYFVEAGAEIYDYATGDYIEPERVREARMANITEIGAEQMQLLFGKVGQRALAIRTKLPYLDEFDVIECEGKAYVLKMAKTFRQEAVYLVEEKQ